MVTHPKRYKDKSPSVEFRLVGRGLLLKTVAAVKPGLEDVQ